MPITTLDPFFGDLVIVERFKVPFVLISSFSS